MTAAVPWVPGTGDRDGAERVGAGVVTQAGGGGEGRNARPRGGGGSRPPGAGRGGGPARWGGGGGGAGGGGGGGWAGGGGGGGPPPAGGGGRAWATPAHSHASLPRREAVHRRLRIRLLRPQHGGGEVLLVGRVRVVLRLQAE